MDETGSSRDIGRTGARTWRTLPWFSIERWALAAGAAVLAALWIWTALTSNHSTRGYNDWLCHPRCCTPCTSCWRRRDSCFGAAEGRGSRKSRIRFCEERRPISSRSVGGIWILAFPVQYSEIPLRRRDHRDRRRRGRDHLVQPRRPARAAADGVRDGDAARHRGRSGKWKSSLGRRDVTGGVHGGECAGC